MIHEIGLEINAKLIARGCPLRVVDGPERTKDVTWGRERIVLEHDAAGDTFGPPRGQRPNPKHRFTRNIGCKLTIFAQSASGGAMEFEHRRRVEHVLDMVLVALEEVAIARRNGMVLKGGKLIDPVDLAGSEVAGGAVYELTFTVERAVEVLTWAGGAQPEATVGPGGVGIKSKTNASIDGTGAVTSCGT